MSTHEQARQRAAAYQLCLHAKQMLTAKLVALPVATAAANSKGKAELQAKL